MSPTHGFELIEKKEIQEYRTEAGLYRHIKTGAQLLSLVNDDENKVFGITFRTPPHDSTGVAHILEHCVLCGSRKYPVKEPFVELLKGSLQTFLNAFTYPDKTCYPVASQNHKDFYNLIDVYLDAVFYPLLDPYIFKQEGWHLEAESLKGPFQLKGVVFNEMKGAYSSPDSVLSEYSLQSLFPDSPYGFDSGGNPKEIPNLTYEQFKAFHERFYHPSNSRIFFYGDDDPETRFKIIDHYLKDFEPLEIDSRILPQHPFPSPRVVKRPYMVGEDTDSPKAMVTCNWVLGETAETLKNFSLRVLEYILLGMPGSPLRKALIESGLGEDLAGDGLGAELLQIYFSTGLKGVDEKELLSVPELIKETLTKLAEAGIDQGTVEAGLNAIEFRLRENNPGRFPRGLVLMLRALTTWLYDHDPFAMFCFEKPLSRIRTSVEKGNYFEGLIHSLLLENNHHTVLYLKPDSELRAREEAQETRRIERLCSSLSPQELEAIVRETLELKKRQQTPDPPEALSKLPLLKLQDLDPENKHIPLAIEEMGPSKLLYHDLFTNGIIYLDLGFDLHKLPEELLPYVPLFGRALVEMGTEKEDFVSLGQRISQKTGGIHPEAFSSPLLGREGSSAWLFLRSKAMVKHGQDLLAILKDILLLPRLDNKQRFAQMVLEEKARVEHDLVPSGHQVVNIRLRSHFGEAFWLTEKIGGLSYLFFLRELASRLESHWSKILDCLTAIKERLFARDGMVANVTLDEAAFVQFKPLLKELMETLAEHNHPPERWNPQPPAAPFEGLIIPSQVNYVGKAASLYQLGYEFHGSALVITRYLRTSWLWDKIRVQGGAYGAFSLFDRFSGVLSLVSYRDPNLETTIEAFDQAGRFLKEMEVRPDELRKAIIGTIGDLDAHMLPDAKGRISMLRYLCGDDDDARQLMRREVLSTEPQHFKTFGHVLEAMAQQGIVKVLGSSKAIEEANKKRPGWLEVIKVL